MNDVREQLLLTTEKHMRLSNRVGGGGGGGEEEK